MVLGLQLNSKDILQVPGRSVGREKTSISHRHLVLTNQNWIFTEVTLPHPGLCLIPVLSFAELWLYKTLKKR